MFPSEGAPSQKSPPALNVQFIKSIPSWPEDAQDCGSTAAAVQFAWCSGGLPLFSSCPPSPLLGTRVQPQRKINKLPFGKRQSLRSTSQESQSSQKTLWRLTSCPCVSDGVKKKKKREKFASSGVLPKPSPFPPEGEKTQDGEGSKENLGFRVFPRKKKKIGWADGRTDGAPTEAP